MKITKQISLLLLTLVVVACDRSDSPIAAPPAKGMQAIKPIEGDQGPEPCSCLGTCATFEVDANLAPTPEYAFAVALDKVTECPPASTFGRQCKSNGERYEITFSFAPTDPDRFGLADIDEAVAMWVDANGQKQTQVFENLEGTKLIVYRESTIYFKWKPGHEHPAPDLANIVTGGICIIGIITDPCCPEEGFRGRRMRPEVLHPF